MNLFDNLEDLIKDSEMKCEPKTHVFKSTTPKRDYIECYTDGGCHNYGKYKGVGAWAYYIKNHLANETYQGCDGRFNTTNNEMELMALYELLKFLYIKVNPHDENQKIKVYSDSGYVVNTINEARYVNWMYNGWKISDGSDVKNAELWKDVISIYREFYNLELIHIRGHIGIYGNERCDKLCTDMINRIKNRRAYEFKGETIR